jgi:hypothetical protein
MSIKRSLFGSFLLLSVGISIPGASALCIDGDAAYINAVKIRFACDIVLKSSAMAPIAPARISTPQPNERFPIHRRRTVDCNYNHWGSGSLRPSDKTIASARAKSSMSASLCSGEGVRRSRSVPRGTVG